VSEAVSQVVELRVSKQDGVAGFRARQRTDAPDYPRLQVVSIPKLDDHLKAIQGCVRYSRAAKPPSFPTETGVLEEILNFYFERERHPVCSSSASESRRGVL
jgi:hypothetical protein